CSSMVEHDLAMVDTGVRFSSSAPFEYSLTDIREFFYFIDASMVTVPIQIQFSSKFLCIERYCSHPIKKTRRKDKFAHHFTSLSF
ncbi:hypothetical protein AAK899_12115, partial [Erysipelotrichaceae bacterium 51-3]